MIDDESKWKGNFGVNFVKGLLGLPIEDMHCRQKDHDY